MASKQKVKIVRNQPKFEPIQRISVESEAGNGEILLAHPDWRKGYIAVGTPNCAGAAIRPQVAREFAKALIEFADQIEGK